jgi:nitrogen fixation protein FixH
MNGTFTGRHMTGILVAFFAVVIAVNVAMATLAGSTFGGVVVDNSYVASQHFNLWLDEAARERAIGWQAELRRLPDGRVAVTLSGGSETALRLAATARHPLGRLPDRELSFAPQGQGRFVSSQPLPAGRWRLRLSAAGHAATWRTEQELY